MSDRFVEKAKETKKRIHSLRSLRTAYTLLVLLILVSAGFITAGIYLILYSLDFIPSAALTPLILPVIVIFSCMIIGTIMAVFVGKLFINPLRRIIEANEAIRQGNFKVRLREHSAIGELNNLMNSFNGMADELEATELFRNDFINSFSHEFKTPIVSIRGFARQLQRDNDQHTLSDEQRKEYTDIIAYESDRLARLSSNILILTKFENQQIVTDRTEFYLDEQIRRTVLLLEKEWTARNIGMELDLSEIKYNFNEEMLAQMWLNLIGNAIKFSPPGGRVTVRLRQKQGYIRVDIADTGDGMNGEALHRIFDKFYQCDTSHKSEGNGLGLAIVKRIAELADAGITVKSEPGKGTVFTVKLTP
ncbi:MAG: HAMP domain-containing histidine kinase [Clostridia bacterium]|nr:HAMP domain-containing histidine kinase [Clostridia bacterium]